MRGIQNNFNNPQINQMAAMEQSAQASKSQQGNRVRAEFAEKILEKEKVQEKIESPKITVSPDSQGKKHQDQPGERETPAAPPPPPEVPTQKNVLKTTRRIDIKI